jgi:1-phosphofructokinase family hexose kinase
MEQILKILCVSANPGLDRRVTLPSLRLAEVNRASAVDPMAGGKAAHVAFVARMLGAEVRWLAFLGGAEGEACREGVAARGVTPIAVPIQGRTRTNLELIDSASGEVTEVLEPGPTVAASERLEFTNQFDAQLRDHPTVVMSGSLPGGIGNSFHAEMIGIAKSANCRVMLDTSGAALAAALGSAPHLIKPNRQEVSALLGREVRSVEEAIEAAKELRQRGPQIVIISLGEAGAVVVTGHTTLHGVAPKVAAKSAVGSGDSFLAGWAVASSLGKPAGDCLRTAIACGAANCLAKSPGIFALELVEKFFPEVQIRQF